MAQRRSLMKSCFHTDRCLKYFHEQNAKSGKLQFLDRLEWSEASRGRLLWRFQALIQQRRAFKNHFTNSMNRLSKRLLFFRCDAIIFRTHTKILTTHLIFVRWKHPKLLDGLRTHSRNLSIYNEIIVVLLHHLLLGQKSRGLGYRVKVA